jgi:hypothetical protein
LPDLIADNTGEFFAIVSEPARDVARLEPFWKELNHSSLTMDGLDPSTQPARVHARKRFIAAPTRGCSMAGSEAGHGEVM